jgi:hypothetical protein
MRNPEDVPGQAECEESQEIIPQQRILPLLLVLDPAGAAGLRPHVTGRGFGVREPGAA